MSISAQFVQELEQEGFCCNFGPATSGWTVFDNDWTGSPIMPSDNPFKWRQFEPGLILLCVRWYLRYAVSYREPRGNDARAGPVCRPYDDLSLAAAPRSAASASGA